MTRTAIESFNYVRDSFVDSVQFPAPAFVTELSVTGPLRAALSSQNLKPNYETVHEGGVSPLSASSEERNMRKSHPKPTNPEDFEILSANLLRAHWECDQLERYSTPGGAQEGIDIIDLSGKEPLRAAQCKLHKDSKPITSREIEDEVAKAREFTPPLDLYVILTTAKGNRDAHKTVMAINRRHRQERLFEVQLMTWNRIEELLDQYPAVRDGYEGGLSARSVAQIGMQLNNIEVRLETRPAEEREDQFHQEIDEAQDRIDSRDYQLAKLLLQRMRTRRWSQLTERHRFRLLTCLAVVAMGQDDWKRSAELFLEAKICQPDDEKARGERGAGSPDFR